MNHLYDAKVLSLAITGYFHDTFNFDADYFYDGYNIVRVSDFLDDKEEHLFMNIVPNDVILTISNFYRKNDFWDTHTIHPFLHISGDSNDILRCNQKLIFNPNARQQFLNTLDVNNPHWDMLLNMEKTDDVTWLHAFGTDIVSKFAKKHWKFKLTANIEQIAIGIIGVKHQPKLIEDVKSLSKQTHWIAARKRASHMFLNKEYDGIGIESTLGLGTAFREWTQREGYGEELKMGDVVELIVDLSTVNDYTLQYIVNGTPRRVIPSTMLNCEVNKRWKLAISIKNENITSDTTQIDLLQ